MNIGNGLKAIVNVAFWIWIAIGALITIGGFNGRNSCSHNNKISNVLCN